MTTGDAAHKRRQRIFLLSTLAVFLVAGTIVTVGFNYVWGLNKKSPAYKLAVARAAEDPDVQQALGTPVETGHVTQGGPRLSEEGEGEAVSLRVPLEGPKGKGTLFIEAHQQGEGGDWTFSDLHLKLDEGQLDLLTPTEKATLEDTPPLPPLGKPGDRGGNR